MESFLSRYKNPLVLLALLLVQVIGLAVQVRRPSSGSGGASGVRLIQYWALALVTPPERLAHFVGHETGYLWTSYIDLIGTKRKNRELLTEIDRLRLEQAGLAAQARQVQQLQALLGFQQKYIYKTVAAQVIGASEADQSHLLILNKGSAEGLKRDDAVITPNGIVGRLLQVFPHTSLLLEISDATSGAGVVLRGARLQGVLRGNAYGQPEIRGMLPDARIKPGVAVVTSGGDQIFPQGLPVGTVEKVEADPKHAPLVNVLIHPAAHLDAVEQVLVITSTGSQMPQQEQQDIAESELDQEEQKASDILAERLPSAMDPEAPPEELYTTTVNGFTVTTPLQVLKPPLPAHPDQFTPGATPPAAEMRPGALNGPIRQGTENMPPPKPAAPSAGAGGQSAGSAAPVGGKNAPKAGTSGVLKPQHGATVPKTGATGPGKRVATPGGGR
jgi:rod shape-determining protein MreC